jgi:hypothetical protein
MPDKQFKIPAADMKPLAQGRGGCLRRKARRHEGIKAQREIRAPHFPFVPACLCAFVPLPATIALLNSPVGSALARRGLFKKFVAVPFEAGEES